MAHDLRVLAELACSFAEQAGYLIWHQRPADLHVRTKSTDTDPVTVMDARSEQLLHDLIRTARPGDGILGEEGAHEASETGLTWVVDPIDGTVNYLYGIPAYAVSVAVCRGDVTTPGAFETVAGAVCNPVTAETFHASRGGGAALRHAGTDTPLAVSSVDNLAHALVGTGFAYDARRRQWQGQVVARVLPQVRDIRRGGSAALDLCFVAAGRLDAYYESGTHIWDRAAGELLVLEAGGVIQGRDGEPSGENLAIAGNSALVRQLSALDLRPDGAS